MPSRRTLLKLLGGGVGVGAVTTGTLPGPLARATTHLLPTPGQKAPVETTAGHLEAYRSRIQQVAEQAIVAWDEMGEPPDDFVEWRREDAVRARQFADGLTDRPATSETTAEARWHLRDAAGALGYARAVEADLDAETAVEGLPAIRESFAAFRESFSYDCANRARFLPYAAAIEESVRWGDRTASAALPGTDVHTSTDRSSDRGVAGLFERRHAAESRLLDAREFRRAYRQTEGGDPEPYGATLDGRVQTLQSELKQTAERVERVDDWRGDLPEPVVNALWERGNVGRQEFDDANWRATEGYRALAATKLARAALHLRGFEAGLDAVRGFENPRRPGAGRIFREKRRAVRRIYAARLAGPDPAERGLLADCGQAVESGDLSLDDPSARNRVEAFVDYRTAKLGAESAGDLADRLTVA